MQARLRTAVAEGLGAQVVSVLALAGGDINEAWEVTLSDGRAVFVKSNANAPGSMFPAEARGLLWLAEADALRLPEVLAVSSGPSHPPFLALELVRSARRVHDFDEQLGRGLAALHRFGAASFGLDQPNFIGSLPQDNTPAGDWTEFFRERRLLPQVERAIENGRAPAALAQGFDRLFDRLPELVGPAEPPARLHGDLWGGNLHVDERGLPCLIDPAVYGGHREMDLAMMRLFGGFSERVFAAYDEAYPLSPGAKDRVTLYQLYPLLVHVNHFGGSYLASVQQALARYV